MRILGRQRSKVGLLTCDVEDDNAPDGFQSHTGLRAHGNRPIAGAIRRDEAKKLAYADLGRHVGQTRRFTTSVPESVRVGLAAKGHQIDLQGACSSMVGGGQSVMRDYAAGVNSGASDPRKDGAAVPEPMSASVP